MSVVTKPQVLGCKSPDISSVEKASIIASIQSSGGFEQGATLNCSVFKLRNVAQVAYDDTVHGRSISLYTYVWGKCPLKHYRHTSDLSHCLTAGV